MKKCEICKLEKKYTREMSFGTVCSMCYLENYASQSSISHRGHTPQTPQNVSGRVQNISIRKKGQVATMLNLSYVVEKEGNLVSVVDRLMLSEYQINNLMDTLVSNGFDVVSMEVK